MRISVVIPAYNVEKFLAKTLDSVFSQTTLPDEVIVINDGSSDRTEEIAKEYDVKYIWQENAGAAAARNNGISNATGDWVAFLDGDDIWLEDKVTLLKEKISSNPNLTIIAHDEYEGSEDELGVLKPLHQNYDSSRPLFNQLFRGCFLSTSAVAVKREDLNKVGGMDIRLRSSQDYDLWLKLSLIGDLDFIPKPLSKYLIRSGNITSNVLLRYKCSFIIIDKYINRVSFPEYIKKVLIIHYEGIFTALSQKQYISILKLLVRMPFKLLKCSVKYFYNRIFNGAKSE